MARQYDVDDSYWAEVMFINGYALFLGYLMMGVRGLGLLIITWTTVVLLGGFVSDLGKKDFWCLTGITLIQTAGVFNFLLTEKLSDMVHLSWGLLGAAVAIVRKGDDNDGISTKRMILAVAASVIQGVVLFVVLSPVAILYVFGIYISAGASLWRLIKHDFGNDGDGGANMKPALQVLYSLAVAQGVFFGYKTMHAFAAKTGLVKFVYNRFKKEVPEALVAKYLEETVAGCEKDSSFATGRNLVTYGVNMMMEAKSNEGFITGIKVLGGAISDGMQHTIERNVLAKCLLTGLDSSSGIIQRLLETVGPRSPYNREIKGHVVRILDILAPCIRLEQFPRAIECLCSVVDTSESTELAESKRGENITTNFDWLLIKAVNMIHKLVVGEHNLWILRTSVSSTILHKIARLPIKLHRESHGPLPEESQLQMLEKCWELTEWLLVALTETSSPPLPAATPVGEGPQITSKEIEEGEEQLLVLRTMDSSALGSTIKHTIKHSIESAIKCILDCLDCGTWEKVQAIEFLLHRSLDMSTIVKDSESSRRLLWVLLLIFCQVQDDGIRRLAGEKLSEMLREKHGDQPLEESERELQLVDLALEDLNRAFHDVDILVRTHAVIIMEGLCENDTRFYEVTKFLVDAIPKVVKEALIHSGSIKAERQEQAPDVEMGNVSHDNQDGCIDTQLLQKALANLCYTYMNNCNTYDSNSTDISSRFKEIASKICEEQGKSYEDFEELLDQSIQ